MKLVTKLKLFLMIVEVCGSVLDLKLFLSYKEKSFIGGAILARILRIS
jgi:hypothetical protein